MHILLDFLKFSTTNWKDKILSQKQAVKKICILLRQMGFSGIIPGRVTIAAGDAQNVGSKEFSFVSRNIQPQSYRRGSRPRSLLGCQHYGEGSVESTILGTFKWDMMRLIQKFADKIGGEFQHAIEENCIIDDSDNYSRYHLIE